MHQCVNCTCSGEVDEDYTTWIDWADLPVPARMTPIERAEWNLAMDLFEQSELSELIEQYGVGGMPNGQC